MKTIPLQKGHGAVVDDRDYERLIGFGWYAIFQKSGPTYAVRKIRTPEGKRIHSYMHVEVCGYPHPDHIDGDGLNNQSTNLRIANPSQNGANRKKQVRTSSRFKGVALHKNAGKWQAQIQSIGARGYLGLFREEFDAAQAYNFAALEAFGEFARLNEAER